MNTYEIPGELSQGNIISSQLKITRFIFHMGKDHCCYGYIINHTFQSKK